jgi:hypothetical protein
MDKRHFTVVEKGGKEHGLYISSTPSSAAKKAVSKLCSSNKSKKVEFYLREITQGSKKKTYGPYLGEMKKLKTPIELKGRIIRYQIKLNLNKRKSSKTKPAKKMRGGQDYFNNLASYQSDMEFPVKNNTRRSRLERKLKESQERLADVQRIQEIKPSNEEIEHIRAGFELVKRGDELFKRAILQNTQNKKELFDDAFDLFKRSYDEYKNPAACERISRYYSTVNSRDIDQWNGSKLIEFTPYSNLIVSKIEKNGVLSRNYLIKAIKLIKEIPKNLLSLYSEYDIDTMPIKKILFHKYELDDSQTLYFTLPKNF